MSVNYQDVSINSFLDQITARLPLLKQQLKDASIMINEAVPLQIVQKNDSEQFHLTS